MIAIRSLYRYHSFIARRILENSIILKRHYTQHASIAATDKRPIKLERLKEISLKNITPFPLYKKPSIPNLKKINFEAIKAEYSHLQNGEKSLDGIFFLEGRIMAKRSSGKKLYFYTILQNNITFQLVVNYNNINSLNENSHSDTSTSNGSQCDVENSQVSLDTFTSINKYFQAGDFLRGVGCIGKTKSGELSIFAQQIPELLSTCYKTIPFLSKLENTETRFRNRHVDFLVNQEARNTIIVRSKVLKLMRKFFDDNGFVEVETPILWPSLGGANAKPFVTSSSALGNTDLFLRISPELFLKQLVIGGFDKVYEIGKLFRNEGIDKSHNPEFTSCEFYQAYANLSDLIKTTEDLISSLVLNLNDNSLILTTNSSQNSNHSLNIDFTPPFNRINIVEFLEKKLDTKFDFLAGDYSDVEKNSDFITDKLVAIYKEKNIPLGSVNPITPSKLMDNLISIFIEPLCINPTFLVGHPIFMSPLAKSNSNNVQHPHTDQNESTASPPIVSNRFELFINGLEFANAYEELNDPDEQRSRFKLQMIDRTKRNDSEALLPNVEFCDALEFGLPPTAGWGLGIDRLVSLLSKSKNLREVISFPIIKP
ncbi:Lysine-tRNA ligase [Smittium culicis]|uniref:lysine--tRNA ligase n=1 Tax=Smittium culicis TaxID=133412 RepID=A0A1R1Y2Z1_9FUNG|nr:Lysine-tRNA ligase [Smittium culicis]